ncbi:invasion associated locus B family protein [Acuticoccus sp. I52.16.1]|uniref:invasion associated locus B family protein n=1 Tax=Acuticoccus sp. I52.16.1 TaxID=2928472 RepID=UPI001FD3C120|nr:invasion associated locus B family protein [Acuticoccus sp. I52.16.1]UOM35017.1 invasion associated locus B family protein [Acuticoccus sp. I52.16.1]
MGPGTFCRIAFAAGLALGAAAPAATAQTPSSLSETYGDWVVRCESAEENRRCWMQQTLTRQPGGERVLQLELTEVDGVIRAVFLTPFGLDVAKGAVLAADGTDLGTFPFHTCLPAGCLVQFEPPQPLLDALRRGDTLTATFQVAQSGESLALELSLNGFSAAHKRLEGFASN